jgi:hypothetical protein
MNNDLESECTYIDDISLAQAATNTDNAIFRLKTRSEIHIDCAKILHTRYLPVKSDLMFCLTTFIYLFILSRLTSFSRCCFTTGSAFKSIESDDHPALVINNQRILPKCSLKYLGIFIIIIYCPYATLGYERPTPHL